MRLKINIEAFFALTGISELEFSGLGMVEYHPAGSARSSEKAIWYLDTYMTCLEEPFQYNQGTIEYFLYNSTNGAKNNKIHSVFMFIGFILIITVFESIYIYIYIYSL